MSRKPVCSLLGRRQKGWGREVGSWGWSVRHCPDSNLPFFLLSTPLPAMSHTDSCTASHRNKDVDITITIYAVMNTAWQNFRALTWSGYVLCVTNAKLDHVSCDEPLVCFITEQTIRGIVFQVLSCHMVSQLCQVIFLSYKHSFRYSCDTHSPHNDFSLIYLFRSSRNIRVLGLDSRSPLRLRCTQPIVSWQYPIC